MQLRVKTETEANDAALPRTQTFGMVNEGLFQTMGLPTHTEQARNRDWTWESVIELGRKLSRDVDGDGRADVFALQHPGTNA
ncbi:MAG: hypothetical protein GX162_02875 [Firmicutes bacterium]|nr:hypothetical protein [Bacillota bacterium]